MVKCPRCGYENASSSVYCDNCAYLLSSNKSTKPKKTNTGRWNVGLGKKILIVLGIIIVALLLFSFIYNNSQPSNNESLNVIYDDGSQQQASSHPYQVVISYNGTWYAEMGDPDYLVGKSGSGENTFTLDCAAWDNVKVNAQKLSGNGEIKIQLLRNGEVVAENSTTGGHDSVSIFYNS